MKVGDEYKCKKCGNDTFVKKESVIDGWTKIGEIFACASCSTKIADIEDATEEEVITPKANSDASIALAKLLNTNFEEKITIKVTDEEKQFCRDCKHFVTHPFLDRCAIHEKNVNPMDDCVDFKSKS